MHTPIQNFSIRQLFGLRNISIDFDDPVKLLISENGGGKTTVLYTLYLILTRQFDELRKFDFEEISLTFSDDTTINFQKSDLVVLSESDHLPPIIREIKDNLKEDFDPLLALCEKKPDLTELLEHNLIVKAASTLKVPRKMLAENLYRFTKDIIEPQASIENRILESFNHNVLYFPTYRRIERTFDQINATEGHSLWFGMQDVANKIDSITSKIKRRSVGWFTDIDDELLDEVYGLVSKKRNGNGQVKSQRLALEPFGADLPEKRKQQILDILKLKDKSKAISPDLAYLFTNLLQIREQQRKYEADIESLIEVCNKYLVDKQFEYNEIDVQLNIIHSKTGKEICLDDLSLGEKQIVSLFVKIYLDSPTKPAIIIDEPELSISIEWQKMLLPDVWNSNNCSFLLAATHSPFIFENDLDAFAVSLNEYIEDLP